MHQIIYDAGKLQQLQIKQCIAMCKTGQLFKFQLQLVVTKKIYSFFYIWTFGTSLQFIFVKPSENSFWQILSRKSWYCLSKTFPLLVDPAPAAVGFGKYRKQEFTIALLVKAHWEWSIEILELCLPFYGKMSLSLSN